MGRVFKHSITGKRKEYSIPTKDEFLQPGGYPDCIIYICDKFNNIYPQINWGDLQARYRARELNEYNNNHSQMALFI